MKVEMDQSPTRLRETSIEIQIPELTAVLAPWRDDTVPIATKGVPPHLSLLYPWRTPPLTAQDFAALHDAIADFRLFRSPSPVLDTFHLRFYFCSSPMIPLSGH